MKSIRSVCVFLITTILLVNTGCIKPKTDEKLPVNKTPTEEQSVVRIIKSDVENAEPVEVTVYPEQAGGVTDINQYFVHTPDKNMARIITLDIEGRKIEHLGVIERVKILKKLKMGYSLTSVDTVSLPRTLEYLDLSQNKLTLVDTSGLPETLTTLLLWGNPIKGTFEVTPSMRHITHLNVDRTNIEKVMGLENLNSKNLTVHFLQSPIQNPEEFLKLKNVRMLTFSVPVEYTDAEIDHLYNKIKEQNKGLIDFGLKIERYAAGEKGNKLIYGDL